MQLTDMIGFDREKLSEREAQFFLAICDLTGMGLAAACRESGTSYDAPSVASKVADLMRNRFPDLNVRFVDPRVS